MSFGVKVDLSIIWDRGAMQAFTSSALEILQLKHIRYWSSAHSAVVNY